MRNFLSKLLFCDVYDLNNVLLHIPVGVANALIGMQFVGVGIVIGVGFLSYEILQRIIERKDKAYPDIQGWLWGLVLTAIIGLIIGVV